MGALTSLTQVCQYSDDENSRIFKNHFMGNATHYGTDRPMQKQKGLLDKFNRSKPMGEDTEDLKTSALVFSFSAEV